jgi:hypothetical protein
LFSSATPNTPEAWGQIERVFHGKVTIVVSVRRSLSKGGVAKEHKVSNFEQLPDSEY